MTKSKCKCKKCGNYYTLFTWEYNITKYTIGIKFAIEDSKDPSKNKVGIAIAHC